jgi:hypothetical protein
MHVVRRLLYIVLILLVVPGLAVASPGNILCQGEMVRATRCCEGGHHGEAGSSPCHGVRGPGCCEIVPSSATLPMQSELDAPRARDLPLLARLGVPFDVSQPLLGSGVSAPEERPPPGCRTFLRHCSLLI